MYLRMYLKIQCIQGWLPRLNICNQYQQSIIIVVMHLAKEFTRETRKSSRHCGDGKRDSWDKQSNYLLLGCNSTCMIVGQGCFMHLHLRTLHTLVSNRFFIVESFAFLYDSIHLHMCYMPLHQGV